MKESVAQLSSPSSAFRELVPFFERRPMSLRVRAVASSVNELL